MFNFYVLILLDPPAYGTCSGGILTPTCDTNKPCPAGYVCENFACEKLCNDDDNCAVNQTCGLSTCKQNCEVSLLKFDIQSVRLIVIKTTCINRKFQNLIFGLVRVVPIKSY